MNRYTAAILAGLLVAARAWDSRGGRSSPGQTYYDADGDVRCCR